MAQYTVNGNAAQVSCNCYDLTQAVINQTGSVWNNNKIDLSQSFDFKFDVYLGNNDNGADGIAFVLQPISTSVGSTGSGLGYAGISPAVGVTIDTYQNGDVNDPPYDHIAIQLNGDIDHSSINNLTGPVTALLDNNNIEDGNTHALEIKWDAFAKTLLIFMDGSLRLNATKDLVTDVFGGNPLVYWGFTGSTGGAVNLQKFCTALNPAFHVGNPGEKICEGMPVSFTDFTISFTTIAKFYWDFGDGSPLDSVNLNPTHTYAVAGNYAVKHKAIGADGCEATKTQDIVIGSIPVANFESLGNCIEDNVYFKDKSVSQYGAANTWYWNLDDGFSSTTQNPILHYTVAGSKTIKLVVQTQYGCVSDTFTKPIIVHSRPFYAIDAVDTSCLGTSVFYSSHLISGTGPLNAWAWYFGDGTVTGVGSTNHIFTQPGNIGVRLVASSTGNITCLGVSVKSIFIVDKPHAAMKQNAFCINTALVLKDSSYATDGITITGWWWDLGNGNFSTQKDPLVTYTSNAPITIKHVVYNRLGCISDTLTQTINLSERPIAKFGTSDPFCSKVPVQFSDSSTVTGSNIAQWIWVDNGNIFNTQQNPAQLFSASPHTVGLIAASAAGCISDTAFKTFTVIPSPEFSMSFQNGCRQMPLNFSATDNAGSIIQWKWLFGDGGIASTQNAQHTYAANGSYPVKLFATAQNGCSALPLEKSIVIYGTNASAGTDTVAGAGQPIPLHATGGISYSWSPANLLNDPHIPNPIAILNSTQLFTVKAYTAQGCETYDDVLVKIYNGPEIYLPNAFTPNGDGTNDILFGVPIGIKQFNYLKIYNRWGELIFYTTDYRKGWDGKWKGQQLEAGIYVVLANGIDFRGNVINKKGTVMLIR